LCDLFATIFVALEETQNLARVQHHQAFIVASKALILQAGLVLRAITAWEVLLCDFKSEP
jgi:hypothetical protein